MAFEQLQEFNKPSIVVCPLCSGEAACGKLRYAASQEGDA